MVTFRKTAEKRLGTKLTCAKLEEVGIPDTPEYLPYSDEDQDDTMLSDLDDQVTPEVGDEYVHASVMLPRGSQLVRDTVKAQKQDLDGNPIGRQSDNPILDTRLYDVEFPHGKVTMLTANVIAQAIYVQCDVNRNKYLLLECLLMYRKTIQLYAWMSRK